MNPDDLLELDDADLVDVLAADAFHGGDLIDRVRLSSWLVTLRQHERDRMHRLAEIARQSLGKIGTVLRRDEQRAVIESEATYGLSGGSDLPHLTAHNPDFAKMLASVCSILATGVHFRWGCGRRLIGVAQDSDHQAIAEKALLHVHSSLERSSRFSWSEKRHAGQHFQHR